MKSVLIVEDSEKISSFIVSGLSAHGFAPTQTSLGEVALSLLASQEFDLVILDIGLPDIDGFEVLRRMRGQGNDTPVLVLTARDSVNQTVASFEGGADDYMSKPFSFEELLARVKTRARKTKREISESVLIHGSVTLDLLRRSATVDGVEHELTAREFTMLEFFVSHHGQVISREQLLSRVWGYDHDPGSNVVDVYIRYLRKKIGADSIQTVRGVGYRMP